MAHRLSPLLLCLLLTGCAASQADDDAPTTATVQSTEANSTDDAELARQVEQVQEQLTRRVEQIDARDQQGEPMEEPEQQQPDDARRFTSITFGRYSGAIDTNADGRDDTVRMEVVTLDQDGRFIRVAGHAVISVVLVNPLAMMRPDERTYTPAQLTAAFRDGPTGTHYLLEIPLPTTIPPNVNRAGVTVTITDERTRTPFRQSAAIRLEH